MTYDHRLICPLCAWRESCAKRFSIGSETTLHCPDFSDDVSLRRFDDGPPAASDGLPGKTDPP